MSYVKVNQEGIIEKWPYSLDDLRSDHPNTSFPADMPDSLLESFGIYNITPTIWPMYDSATHKRIEAAPIFLDGLWIQQWTIIGLTQAEIAASLPKTIKMRQVRIALHRAGLLTQAIEAIAAMTGDAGLEARIEWEFADEVNRDSPLVQGISSQLGISDEMLDELFKTAASL